jgi:Protein of unknown function (DUF1501)
MATIQLTACRYCSLAAASKGVYATMLHLMGIDHEHLTYRYSGRDHRLTDVEGHVVREILGEHASAYSSLPPQPVDRIVRAEVSATVACALRPPRRLRPCDREARPPRRRDARPTRRAIAAAMCDHCDARPPQLRDRRALPRTCDRAHRAMHHRDARPSRHATAVRYPIADCAWQMA